jgi:hypothetical protein
MAPSFDNPDLDLPAAPGDSSSDLPTVAGTEIQLPPPREEGGASFIKKRIASYLHLDLKRNDILALLGLSPSAYDALLQDPEVQAEQKRIAAEELHRAAFLRLQLAQTTEQSLRTLIDLRDHGRDERTRLAAAESLLDREGSLNRKIQPTQTAALLVVSDDQVKAGLRAALESLTQPQNGTPVAISSGGTPIPEGGME